MRKILCVAVVLASACGAPPAPTPRPAVVPTPSAMATAEPSAPAPDPAPTEAAGDFSVDAAMQHTRFLAVDIGLRPSGSAEDGRAAQYLASTMRDVGLTPTMQSFELPQSGTSQNVIGTTAGFQFDRPYLVVGGHYDSLNGPGANDNATGVAVVLEVARALQAQPSSLPVAFVGFGAEERQPFSQLRNHLGSQHYVEQMDETARKNLVAMLNVDMVGFGPDLVAGRISAGPREATSRLLASARDLKIAARERVTPNWSDHGTFAKAGLNAGWIWSGDDRTFHSPRDNLEHINWQRVAEAGSLALAFLRSYPPR